MSNMSYCRFQNTANDFDDCADVIEELLEDGGAEDSEQPLDTQRGNDELAAAKRLIVRAYNVIELLLESQGKDVHDLADADYPERLLEQALDDMQETAQETAGESEDEDEDESDDESEADAE